MDIDRKQLISSFCSQHYVVFDIFSNVSLAYINVDNSDKKIWRVRCVLIIIVVILLEIGTVVHIRVSFSIYVLFRIFWEVFYVKVLVSSWSSVLIFCALFSIIDYGSIFL